MLKHSRATEAYRGAAPHPLPSMPLVTHALGVCPDGDAMPLHAPDGARSVGLWPWTVRAVRGVLQELSQQEEQVVRMRYGIGTRPHSVQEIGERLMVMPRQVERIELRAFRKLRDTSVVQDLLEEPATLPEPLRGGGDRPPLPAEPPQAPDEPVTNPWDEV